MTRLTPLDGRYSAKLVNLTAVIGEDALSSARVRAECEYFIALSELGLFPLSKKDILFIRGVYNNIGPTDFDILHQIEFKGYKTIKATNHDVKAVEYYIKERFTAAGLNCKSQWLHFALTSEDINSLSYALMIRAALEQVLLPTLSEIHNILLKSARKYAACVMLARTHGQAAVPTTFGKEFKVFEYRLKRQIEQLKKQVVSCKLGGAVGNYTAHMAAFPDVDWPKFAEGFISSFNKGHRLKISLFEVSTQVDPHDTYAEIFDNIRRVNTILLDFTQDMWRYISDGLLAQKAIAGEVGSSTMPQKINPIDFENAEGNLGLANVLFTFFSAKLPVSRLQRDLSDSTVLRNIGPAFGYCEVAWRSLIKGMSKTEVDVKACLAMLEAHPEVLAEGVQTVLRAAGVENAYEKLKKFTRGKIVSAADLAVFIESLEVSPEVKGKLASLNVKNYIGTAVKAARKV